jgi:hypothetical protein
MTPQPIAPYPVQKLAGELYMQSYARVYGMETVCLRYFNIFGPRQAPDSPYSGVIAKWALQMLRGEETTLQGDGEQGRDFTYIANAVSANLLALEAPAERSPAASSTSPAASATRSTSCTASSPSSPATRSAAAHRSRAPETSATRSPTSPPPARPSATASGRL